VPWTWVLLVAFAAIAVYANSLGGTLLYDDVNAIRTNALVRTGDVVGILTEPSWWGNARGRLWRPLTTLTFALDHALHGLEPFGYHLGNVAGHAVVSVLVLVVFAAVTMAPRAALAAALLFATHPIHTEAVANVVGRAELIAAGGFLLAWYCWLAADAAETGRARGRAAVWMAGAVAAYFLALCGKENAIALPAVLAFADLLGRRGEPLAALARRRVVRYATLAGTAVVFVILRRAIIGQLTPSPELLDNPLGSLAMGARLMTAIKVIGLYALRLLFPLGLSADYSFDQVTAAASPADPGFLGGLGVLLGAAVLGGWAWRRVPALALGLGMLGLTFTVVSNLVFLIGTIMGERLLYLPSAGFCLAVAAALAHVGGEREVDAGRSPGRWSFAFALPLAVVVGLYGARTVARNAVWHDPLVFFSTMVADAPRSARSHRELALVLADLGRFDEARRAFERSLAIKPEDATTLYNFGNALGSEGRFEEAVAVYERAVAVNPAFGAALENLGNAESMRGNQQAALVAMRRALALTPDSPMLQMNIANTLFRAGSPTEARAAYERARSLAPGSPEVLTNYGSFLYAQGDFATAIRVFGEIPEPAPARALVALVGSYRALGRTTEARAALANAVRLYPRDAGVQQTAELLRRDAAGGGAPP
jgi:Tfp pilus assembly protein PilF